MAKIRARFNRKRVEDAHDSENPNPPEITVN